MNKIIHILFFQFVIVNMFSQKDSLQIGDRYAEDQIYASISFSQFITQPSSIRESNFSYSFSTGFIKDIILNKQGNFSIAAGLGYGFDMFNHQLKVEEINNSSKFSNDNSVYSNIFKSHNLEIPLEFRWRTSTAIKYNFWRVYTGVTFLYNLSNKFQFTDSTNTLVKYSNVSAYNKFQYGLTVSAGYKEFNIHVFYGLTPLFKDATINNEAINTKILKLGLIFFIL